MKIATWFRKNYFGNRLPETRHGKMVAKVVWFVDDKLGDFEPQSWRDVALIPWWLLRYVFAWCWKQVWYPAWRLHIWVSERWGMRLAWLPDGGGRWVDPDPVMCRYCLWAGPRRWTFHTYGDDGSGEDVEPVDECPRCGMEI
jgi:hypothetical protein